ncbi:hypothetical protein K488DRAFT_83918 [Vararia minispora EC-137]|uniref:Uncharacterized protein n=1 Tax=Vararia minispora EC-137 TaxID=1314806 RepID=A0ACB8QRK1_9AGAM|nr:hypothetical protein K488DRAFT_83918 [Vararia minispora EC-137]
MPSILAATAPSGLHLFLLVPAIYLCVLFLSRCARAAPRKGPAPVTLALPVALAAADAPAPADAAPYGTAHKPRRAGRPAPPPSQDTRREHPLQADEKHLPSTHTPAPTPTPTHEPTHSPVPSPPVDIPHRADAPPGSPCRCRVCRVRLLAGVKGATDWHCKRAPPARV